MEPRLPAQLCGYEFGVQELATVEAIVGRAQPRLRAEIARRVCDALGWRDGLGRAKLMGARVALLKLHRLGFIELPEPRNGNGNAQPLSRQAPKLPDPVVLETPAGQLKELHLVPVVGKELSALCNGLIERYHYLGYQPLAGAQLRYLIRWRGGELGVLSWGAAAWKVGPRDRWIGWDAQMREKHLGLVLNNARFLILPWIHSKNLASKVLAMSARRVARDFEQAYGVRPVLLETFVESARFTGTCYRAANWIHLGHTQGRGKCDREHRAALPVKEIYALALEKDFRSRLGVGA